MRQTSAIIIIVSLSMVVVGCSKLPFLGQTDSVKEEPVITEEQSQEEQSQEEMKDNTNPSEVEELEKKALIEEEPTSDENDEQENEEVAGQLGDYHVFLDGEVLEEDHKIIINGKSNLVPGARVVGEVFTGAEDEPEFYADTSEKTADDGTFHMELEHPQMAHVDEINVQVKFHFDTQQSDEVIRHYGDRGQKLEGPYIYKHQRESGGRSQKDIYNMAKVTTSFEPKETLSVRQFSEPKWNDIPEDMGDTRVWMKLEEINDDGEFYYLHGQSNLVEGSRIRVEYGSNVGNTHVLPDGSFDFKIDYEYLEDTPFELYFKPYDYQWNMVEEVYGMEGQRLVGNLVETSNSNKQFIKLEVADESQEIEVPDNVELNVEGSEVTMLVPDDVLFDFDKYELKDSSKELLKEIAETLDTSFNKEDPEILITGHTDNVGADDYNLDLSEKRANQVKQYLEKQLESNQPSFEMEGLGSSEPIASNDTEKGQKKNRRVEIIVNLK